MNYFAGTGERCASLIEHSALTESMYLAACLESLKIEGKTDPSLLFQVDPQQPDLLCDSEHVAFHPLKSWAQALQCMQQSSQKTSQRLPTATEVTETTLFCFTVLLPFSYEAVLAAAQYVEGLGVFSCDDHMLFSNSSAEDLFPPGIHPAKWPSQGPDVHVIPGTLKKHMDGNGLSSWDAASFLKVWDALFQDPRYLQSDWTLKVQPDAVFLPSRLRATMWQHCPARGDRDCDALLVRTAMPNSPFEVMSKAAVATYSTGYLDCMASLGTTGQGDGEYLAACFKLLDIETVLEPSLFSEQVETCDG
eukprot:CAMPEP_0203945956 /NCGR_PEP_ID=MMETSP0359-20131031/81348_1 /ASSEMBLY_ACC=CAM_ASM_000338 /TAXON_ID=268821 /ORGANISM="Scrippsiella Hangoei, Strain SHTV-5" /LENGTH=305 /DNA_ID=CAMNT_0050877179 /DNA_START=111 /DNA_END=1025 /DNA_ORIENTATION=+